MEDETYKLKYSDEYLNHLKKHLKSGQRKVLTKIDSLLDEIEIHPTTGTWKFEPLKWYGELNVYYRRIDKKHRFTFVVFEEESYIEILSAYGHYE